MIYLLNAIVLVTLYVNEDYKIKFFKKSQLKYS